MSKLSLVLAATFGLSLLSAQSIAQEQEGLVNVNCVVCDNNTQVAIPIGVAAQVCGVDANVIAEQKEAALTECEINEQTVSSHQALQNFVKKGNKN
jgi:hypothetical protein